MIDLNLIQKTIDTLEHPQILEQIVIWQRNLSQWQEDLRDVELRGWQDSDLDFYLEQIEICRTILIFLHIKN